MDFEKNNIFEDSIDSLPKDKRNPDKDTYSKISQLFKGDDIKGSSHSHESDGFCKRYRIDVWILVVVFILLTMPFIDNKCSTGILKNCTIRYLLKILIFIVVTVFVGMLM